MAKFSAAILALFCLFALSLARSTAENDDSTTAVSLPLSESRPVLQDTATAETESKSAVVTSVRLTKITFRPVNRRFQVGSKDPCHHHFKFHPTLRGNKEISYGNDMILSSGENGDFENPALRDEGQGNHGRWVRLHHHHHEDEDSDSDSDSDDEKDHDQIKKAVFRRYDYNRFDREKKLKVLKKMRKHFKLQNEEEKKGGFMRRVRKFFDFYF